MSKPHTLVHQLARWADVAGDRPAIHGRTGPGQWHSRTWSQYWREAREVARGLQALGHQVGDCVAIVAENRPEWSICQFGIMANRGVPAPIYTTLTWEQVAYILTHSQSKIAICDTAAQLEKYQRCIAEGATPTVEHIITLDDLGSDDDRVITYQALLELGRDRDEAELDARVDALTDTETALLIYTTGTTGQPKAVQIEHGGVLSCADACLSRFSNLRQNNQYSTVSYLPLCHVAEQLFTTFFHLDTGGQVYYCPDIKQLKDYLVDVRPTFFVGVPRVWEKFQAVLQMKLGAATGVKARLTRWALATELASFKKESASGVPHNGKRRRLANRLVISKIKSALGLEDLLIAGTGAAPISVDTLEFFASLGVTIYEGYGMSETTGLATLNEYMRPRFGSVGTAIDGVEIKIAEDDEILLKGRGMTRGYLRQPEQTKELLDDDGWLHTGDLGSLVDGHLKITGRKKDLLITAGGKNVAPALMEGHLKSIFGISQAVVVGDGQPYLSALLTLDGESLGDLAEKVGITAGTVESMASDAKLRAWVTEQMEARCNAKVARYQMIKKFEILPTEFTVDSGEVTPTMKIKRNVVNEKYADEINRFYA